VQGEPATLQPPVNEKSKFSAWPADGNKLNEAMIAIRLDNFDFMTTPSSTVDTTLPSRAQRSEEAISFESLRAHRRHQLPIDQTVASVRRRFLAALREGPRIQYI
jgi:hypothetical protein